MVTAKIYQFPVKQQVWGVSPAAMMAENSHKINEYMRQYVHDLKAGKMDAAILGALESGHIGSIEGLSFYDPGKEVK